VKIRVLPRRDRGSQAPDPTRFQVTIVKKEEEMMRGIRWSDEAFISDSGQWTVDNGREYKREE
jgi:hypothetical protein